MPTILANATMMPSLFGVTRIDGVYWTLEFEIRFYFLVFLLVLFRQMHRLEYWLYVWLAICLISRLITIPWPLPYFLILGYAPLFISGALFYVVYSEGWDRKRALLLLVSLVLCIQGALEKQEGFLTPDQVSAWVVPILTSLCFIAFLFVIRSSWSWLSAKVAYRLGALTYPLYLTHALIGQLLIGLMIEPFGPWLTLLLITGLAFALAALLVITVDEPARRPVSRACRRLWTWVKSKSVLEVRSG